MTICTVSALDDIRSKLCEIHDLLTLAANASGSPAPEWTAVRHARQMADDLVGAVNELAPLGTTGDDPWADLKAALSNLAATGYDMTSLRVSFATRSLIVHWHTGAPTIDSFRAPQGEPEGSLPGGPMEPEELTGEAAQA